MSHFHIFLSVIKKKHLHIYFLIGLICAFLYLPFLQNGLIFDDHNLYTNLAVYEFARTPFDFRARTFPYFSLGVVQVLFDSIPASRFISLLLHAVCSFGIFLLVRKLLSDALIKGKEESSNASRKVLIVSIAITLWFAVNPAAVYGAGYLVQRTILLATLFSLLSLLFFCRAIYGNRIVDVVMAAVCYSLAVFSKEHAIMLPFAVILLVGLRDNRENRIKAIWYFILCIPAAVTVYFAARAVVGNSYEPEVQNLLPLIEGIPLLRYKYGQWMVSALMQMGAFFDYIFYWLVPDVTSMSIDMRVEVNHVWHAWWFFPKAVLFLAVPALSWVLLKRGGLAAIFACGLGYCWFLFFTELVSVRFQEPFVLYRSYIWAPGYALMLAALCCRIKLNIFLILAIPSLLICSMLARDRLSSMENEGVVWKDAAQKLDNTQILGSGRIFYNRAKQYMIEKKYDQAISDFSHTIEQNPDAYYAYYARAKAFYALEQYADMKRDLDAAQRVQPDYGPIYYARGRLFEKYDCKNKAIQSYVQSLELGVSISSLRIEALKKDNTGATSTPCEIS